MVGKQLLNGKNEGNKVQKVSDQTTNTSWMKGKNSKNLMVLKL